MVVTRCHLEFCSTWSFAPFHGYSSFAYYMFRLEPFFPFPGGGSHYINYVTYKSQSSYWNAAITGVCSHSLSLPSFSGS